MSDSEKVGTKDPATQTAKPTASNWLASGAPLPAGTGAPPPVPPVQSNLQRPPSSPIQPTPQRPPAPPVQLNPPRPPSPPVQASVQLPPTPPVQSEIPRPAAPPVQVNPPRPPAPPVQPTPHHTPMPPIQTSSPQPMSPPSQLNPPRPAPPTPPERPQPGRALANVSPPPRQQPSGLQRAAGALRAALPFVQRILPLLDGNVATAVANIMTPQQKPPAPAPPVDLVPIQNSLADLRIQQRTLRDQVVEQNASLKKVGDQLQHVREATDRNTLEQQELLGELKTVGKRVNLFAFLALALLGISVLLNVVLYLQIRHIIP